VLPQRKGLITGRNCQSKLHHKLQHAITNTRRGDHITPVLADLHWLSVRFRIEYKIALITFKALTTQQPQYLAELIRYYEAPRQLRSRSENILQNSASVLNFSKHAFCHASLQSGIVFLDLLFLI